MIIKTRTQNASIPQAELKSLFSYNSKTGDFIRLKRTKNNQKVGTIAGHKNKRGYVIITIEGRRFFAHRLAWLYLYGEFPIEHIDHINHNAGDNRIQNLRSVTHKENHKNQSVPINNKSGVIGVTWARTYRAWQSQIFVNGRCHYLGRFQKKEAAISARKQAEFKYRFHENHGVRN